MFIFAAIGIFSLVLLGGAFIAHIIDLIQKVAWLTDRVDYFNDAIKQLQKRKGRT